MLARCMEWQLFQFVVGHNENAAGPLTWPHIRGVIIFHKLSGSGRESEGAAFSHVQEHPHDHVSGLDAINIDNVIDQVGLSWSLPSHIY